MQVLRDRIERVESAARVRRLHGLAARHDPQAFLVELGMLEQGAIDHARSRVDDIGEHERAFTRALSSAGEACTTGDRERTRAALLRALRELDALAPSLPRYIEQRTPEGYLHYALDPLAYAASARAYASEVGAARASGAVVLGVRSIGTSLSAIVAAAIGARSRATIRPRGPSGARRIHAGTELVRFVVSRAKAGADVLIVDEGPGVTGETFEVVARWLCELGVPGTQIRLLPSHSREPELASEARRAFLRRFRSHAPPAHDGRPARIAARLGCEVEHELSGGEWRSLVSVDAPSRGLFERRKILLAGQRGERALLRWAGIGEPAERALELASALEDDRLTVAARAAGEGFALRSWVDAVPRARGEAIDAEYVSALARYLARRARIARTGRPAQRGPIVSMLVENALEHGGDPGSVSAASNLVLALAQREASIVDGRLAPWEWLRARDRWLKIDAVDHGDGVHLPGPVDAAWDLAGAWIEHGLDASTVIELARRCSEATREPWRAHADAACAYLAPYAAWALADARLCARTAGPKDRACLLREIAFYGRALDAALDRALALAPTVARSFPSAA